MTKIVGVGLGKTGTTSLGAACRILGLSHKTHDPALFDALHRGAKQSCLDEIGRFESFEDFPWNILYRDIDRLYPGSLFILTLRRDPETWYRSLCAHWERTGNSIAKRHAYGHMSPIGERDYHVALYEQHTADVRAWFADRPGQLLTVCWENGDGWEELCAFLSRPLPRRAFPHANRTPPRGVAADNTERRHA
jgi:Sulfotransferase domain